MGLLDRFKGKKKSAEPAPELEEAHEPGSEAEAPAAEPSEAPPAQDMTDQWMRPQQAAAPPPPSAGVAEPPRMTGAAGAIRPLTQSVPVAVAPEARLEQKAPSPAPARRTVEPVSEDRIDELHAKAMQGHSSKDVQALWDAVLSRPELHILQRGKGEKVEAHAVESPLGPMLLMFTSKFRAQALASTKAYRNMPFVWSTVTMPLEEALNWAIRQREAGVQAVEINRGVDPGLAAVLQAIPAHFERVHGRRLAQAELVDPDFRVLANRAKISGSTGEQAALLDAFSSLQRWYALRDPQRPHQPGFTPIDGKPALMLFTSEAEARAAAVAVGRRRELPEVILPLQPQKIAHWMGALPDMGAEQTVVNLASTAFIFDLKQVQQVLI